MAGVRHLCVVGAPGPKSHVNLKTTNIYAEIDREMKVKALALCDAAEAGAHRPRKEDKGLMAFLKAM